MSGASYLYGRHFPEAQPSRPFSSRARRPRLQDTSNCAHPRGLLNSPDIATIEQLLDISLAGFRDSVLDLIVHERVKCWPL